MTATILRLPLPLPPCRLDHGGITVFAPPMPVSGADAVDAGLAVDESGRYLMRQCSLCRSTVIWPDQR
jgi:hypothetical protein